MTMKSILVGEHGDDRLAAVLAARAMDERLERIERLVEEWADISLHGRAVEINQAVAELRELRTRIEQRLS